MHRDLVDVLAGFGIVALIVMLARPGGAGHLGVTAAGEGVMALMAG